MMSIWFRDSRQFSELQAAADISEWQAENAYNASRRPKVNASVEEFYNRISFREDRWNRG